MREDFQYDMENRKVYWVNRDGIKKECDREDYGDLIGTAEEGLPLIDFNGLLKEKELECFKNYWKTKPLHRTDLAITNITKYFPVLFRRYLHQELIPDIKKEIRSEIEKDLNVGKIEKEIIKKERIRASRIVEELMEDDEYGQPIVGEILNKVVINKNDIK